MGAPSSSPARETKPVCDRAFEWLPRPLERLILRLPTMTESQILIRYVSEVAYRWTLSLFSRPHSSECGINQHLLIIDALESGDTNEVISLMHGHLDSVAGRALVAQTPQRSRDLLEVLASHIRD